MENIFHVLQAIDWQNVNSGVIGMFISFTALLIAIIALRMSMLKAELHLYWTVYDQFEQHKDGQGVMKLTADFDAPEQVTVCRPGGEISLSIVNKGKVAAKNAVLDIRFENMGLIGDGVESYPGWKLVDHLHGFGTWTRIRWISGVDVLVHPGIPIEFHGFSLSRAYVAKEGAKAHIILSADNAKAKRFTIPVTIETR